jgi:hypothetical protein
MTPVDLTTAEAPSPEFVAKLNAMLSRVFGPEPRYRYYQRGNGPMFCWTTEKNPGDGKYASFVYRPIGRGARTGKAARWELVESNSSKWKLVEHSKRKTAKARALRLYQAWMKEQS